jgi:hypothetical protein
MFKKLAITTKINFEKELNYKCNCRTHDCENENHKNNKHRNTRFSLPIKKIDNINVKVSIDVFRNHDATLYGMDLEIKSAMDIKMNEDWRQKDLYDRRMFLKKEKFELEDYEKGFMRIYELLPTLKMNKLTNSFDTEIHLDDEELTLLCNHTNTETNECCVCKELTGDSFIICKHILCIECFGNLKHNHGDDDDENDDDDVWIHCPVCRERIGN